MNHCLSQEQTIYRLIENQLSDSDRADLLLAADRQPELWRKISLTFIEEQIWSSVISGQPGESKLRPFFDKALPNKRTSNSWMHALKPWCLALAAVALLTATISVRMLALNGETGTSTAGPDPGRINMAVNDEPYFLEMGDRQVPLYEQYDSMKEFLARSEGELSPELLQHLHSAGLDVQPKTRYITGNAPDGRSFMFPVKQFSVRSRFQ